MNSIPHKNENKLFKLFKTVFNWFTNKWFLIGITSTLVFIVFSNVIIVQSTEDNIFNDLTIPSNDVGLILGTSRYTHRGTTNLFFKYRIEAAAKLYHGGKVKHFIVSGDNSVKEYNEPREMQKALIEAGVPSSAITLDYAGFRTLDSVVRCLKVFGQQKITIISQRFHVERALFIANKYDMLAVGYAASDPPHAYSKIGPIREYFAKTKAIIDLYLIHKNPKFLGKEEIIEISK